MFGMLRRKDDFDGFTKLKIIISITKFFFWIIKYFVIIFVYNHIYITIFRLIL